jgi:CRISPR/Cas system-associated exonuclease Cas4 (RecB family)
MKKMMLTLAIAVSTLSAFAVEEKVSTRVLNAFKSEFNTAKEVEWTASNSYYMAKFNYNDKYVFAYYNIDGILLGLSHYMSPAELPMILQTSLKKNYSNYWISDLFEVAKNGITEYYITLENADRQIILQSSGGDEWESYRKVRKA